jgi:hypothetical protein
MREKWLAAVPKQFLSSDGKASGEINVSQSALRFFKVKQEVLVGSSSVAPIELEVKRVYFPNIIYLGPKKSSIDTFSDLSSLLAADSAYIEAQEQPRSKVPEEQIERLTYEEEPVVARRSFLVDKTGRSYETDNPFPVQLSDGSINIETLNANLSVQLSHLDDFPTAGDVNDSVRIGDGEDVLEINPDGSINITVAGIPVNEFDDANAVVSGVKVNIVSYTVPIGYNLHLQLVEFNGENIGAYELRVAGTVIARKNTWFGGGLFGQFDFNGAYRISGGQTIDLRVIHERPDPAQFSGRICGNLVEV